MKKTSKIVLIALALVSFLSCNASKKNTKTITVGATPEPHAAILNLLVDNMKDKGFTLKVQEFTDYVTPNEAVESGDIDANFFQHVPYMDSFNAERNYHLVNVAGVHIEPIALYSNKIKALSELKDGAQIAIPNDPTNEGRALLLLQSAGLIKVDEKAGLTAVPADITENTKKIKFQEIEAASLPRVLPDVDAAVINGNYALNAGLTAKKDGLFIEGADSPYVNILTVKAGNENNPAVQALVELLRSDEVKEYIEKTYPDGDVVPVF